MARNSSRKISASSTGWLFKSMRVNVVLLVVVVLAVAGVGTYFVRNSSAFDFGIHCTDNLYGRGYDTYGYCIEHIKADYNDLNFDTNWNFSVETPTKSWTSTAASNTRHFQSVWGIGVDGIVGPVTWQGLCRTMRNNGYSSGSGWFSWTMENDWYASGCNNQ